MTSYSEYTRQAGYGRGLIIDTAFQTMLANTTDMVFVKDINLVYVAASRPFVQMVGKASAHEIIGRTDFEIFDDENLAKRYTSDDRKLLEGGQDLIDYIEPLTEESGHARYGSTSKYILSACDRKSIGILGVTRDITREYMARQHHQQELKYLFELPEDTYTAIFIDIDDWRVVGERRRSVRNYTMPQYDKIDGLINSVLAGMTSVGSDSAAFYRSFSRHSLREIYASGRRTFSMEYPRVLSNGALRWVRDEMKFLTDPANGHLCVMFAIRDIDMAKRAEMELIHAAETDEMTGLLNRASTMKGIQQALDGSQPEDLHALFMIDVDNFKTLNDTLGHQAGDEFLITLARELRKCFRESDLVGRVGGDEFFALMKSVYNPASVKAKAEALLRAIREVSGAYPDSIGLSGSIGISMYPKNGTTLEGLYAKADDALYQAKGQGKNRYALASE